MQPLREDLRRSRQSEASQGKISSEFDYLYGVICQVNYFWIEVTYICIKKEKEKICWEKVD